MTLVGSTSCPVDDWRMCDEQWKEAGEEARIMASLLRVVEDEHVPGRHHTLYCCSSCHQFRRHWSFPDNLPDSTHPDDVGSFPVTCDDLADLCCHDCEVDAWHRDWHMIDYKTDDKKLVYSRITGSKHPAGTTLHTFRCSRCHQNKPKASYNYAEVENALESRVQPTCAVCLPDLPKHIHKLKVGEMRLYLDAWGYPPAKTNLTKKEVLQIFRSACKKRIRDNFFRSAKKRDVGLKDGSSQRTLALMWEGGK